MSLKSDQFELGLVYNMGLPRREKNCLRGFANNTGADQPAHPLSLISAFVIRFPESFICKLASGEISIFKLVSVAEETRFVVNPENRFSHDEAYMLSPRSCAT